MWNVSLSSGKGGGRNIGVAAAAASGVVGGASKRGAGRGFGGSKRGGGSVSKPSLERDLGSVLNGAGEVFGTLPGPMRFVIACVPGLQMKAHSSGVKCLERVIWMRLSMVEGGRGELSQVHSAGRGWAKVNEEVMSGRRREVKRMAPVMPDERLYIVKGQLGKFIGILDDFRLQRNV